MEILISEKQDALKRELEKTAEELLLNLKLGHLSSRMEMIELKIAEKLSRRKDLIQMSC